MPDSYERRRRLGPAVGQPCRRTKHSERVVTWMDVGEDFERRYRQERRRVLGGVRGPRHAFLGRGSRLTVPLTFQMGPGSALRVVPEPGPAGCRLRPWSA